MITRELFFLFLVFLPNWDAPIGEPISWSISVNFMVSLLDNQLLARVQDIASSLNPLLAN